MNLPPPKLAAAFAGKTVLVLGHTGFKGSWLVAWLDRLGARVVGVAIDIPTQPSHFETLGLAARIDDRRVDIRDGRKMAALVAEVRPDFVFHLAAQALVRKSYRSPLETFEVNTLGTANVLEALRLSAHPCTAIMITSDKCYDNVEWLWGYRETDRLGGKDPYSGSKGAAELVIRSYFASYFSAIDSPIRIAVGRAGNVIGGGDWAEDRIVPDCMRAWAGRSPVEIRNPSATRPWQHVLEPLSGYLWLAACLAADAGLGGEPFNFGPAAGDDRSVRDVIKALAAYWPGASYTVNPPPGAVVEAGLLKLNCDKAAGRLGWRPTLDFSETINFTGDWYRAFYHAPSTAADRTLDQIHRYEALGSERRIDWAS
jgi:CDP-glucose 4,6-dehydratase